MLKMCYVELLVVSSMSIVLWRARVDYEGLSTVYYPNLTVPTPLIMQSVHCSHVWISHIHTHMKLSFIAVSFCVHLPLEHPGDGPFHGGSRDLSVPAHQSLQHRIVDERILILQMARE